MKLSDPAHPDHECDPNFECGTHMEDAAGMSSVDTQDLLRRMRTPTSWKVGDRVRLPQYDDGDVLIVQNAEGKLDGIQTVVLRLDNGQVLASIGGELDPASER
jgi:hypothetical protein